MTWKHLAAAAALTVSTFAAPAMAANFDGQVCTSNNPAAPAVCMAARLEILRGGAGHLFVRTRAGTQVWRLQWRARGTILALDVAGTTSTLTTNGTCARGTVVLGGRTLSMNVCR